jgi:type VI secretion system protein ImpK
MSDDNDGGKTVIRPMPGAGAFGAPAPAAGSQKTVIGGGLPAPGQPAPQGGGFGGSNPFGGGTDNGFGSPPPSSGGFGAPQGGGSNDWMGAKPKDQGFFPEARRPEPAMRASPTKKISLDRALSASVSGHSSEANPITAAAAALLILFGRLRSQIVEMQAVPLMQYVTEEIEKFEQSVLAAGVDPTDMMIAKYCLCGTADDIVQNLPGTDRSVWLQYSMVARFFNKRTSGVGFFQEVDKALQNPIQKYYLLELMLICLQLGFEGQYRAMAGGDVQLQNVKRGIYEALRRVKPRGDDDISPAWKGVELAVNKNAGGIPVWAIACFAGALMVGAYFTMRLMLVDEGNTLATRMVSLHPSQMIKLSRNTEVEIAYVPPVFVAESNQRERIEEALAGEAVTIVQQGDFIVLDVNNTVLFDSGKAEVKAAFAGLAAKIAAVLDGEPGPVRVIGHTDNVPMSGRGRYKNNFELSVARANAVAKELSFSFTDPARIQIDGRGEDEPTADNNTNDGRSLNRRVEIMIQRDDTL